MRKLLVALATVASLLLPTALVAQNFPGGKPVKIIVPSGPGASNDTFARFLADKLSQKWGSAVVVENMPGAGGSIGFAALARSAPDGHTLVLFSSSFATNAAAQSNLPFDPVKDILPVAKFSDGQLIVVASKRLGLTSVADLVAAGKDKTVFIAGTGPASTPTFVGLQLADVLGIKNEIVNYKGGAEALLDIAGGRADIYVGTVSTIRPVVEKGDAIPLAVLQQDRAAQMPDVPSIVEAGFPDGASSIWNAVFAPGGTPAATVETLNAAINEVLALDETKAMLDKNGSTAAPMSATDFQIYVTEELLKWKGIAEKFKIKS